MEEKNDYSYDSVSDADLDAKSKKPAAVAVDEVPMKKRNRIRISSGSDASRTPVPIPSEKNDSVSDADLDAKSKKRPAVAVDEVPMKKRNRISSGSDASRIPVPMESEKNDSVSDADLDAKSKKRPAVAHDEVPVKKRNRISSGSGSGSIPDPIANPDAPRVPPESPILENLIVLSQEQNTVPSNESFQIAPGGEEEEVTVAKAKWTEEDTKRAEELARVSRTYNTTELFAFFAGKSESTAWKRYKRAISMLETEDMGNKIKELETKNAALEMSLETEKKKNASFTGRKGFEQMMLEVLKEYRLKDKETAEEMQVELLGISRRFFLD